MNLSNTSQYAIRVVSYMTFEDEDIYSASSLISKLGVSDKYLKRILTQLSEHGILRSTQGRYGGYILGKSPDKITLIEIVQAMESVEKYFGCVLGFESCTDEDPCTLHNKWAPIRNELMEFLNKTTIKDVLSNPSIIKF
ncbi:MAG: hypothetical protein C0595_14440 [Marinilabiliales bacterium]|nr:MAG: hypothetical protein C0595_14440 [Marinilabiliales bacterium]